MKSDLEITTEKSALNELLELNPSYAAKVNAALDALGNNYGVDAINSMYAESDEGDGQCAAALQETSWKNGEDVEPYSVSLARWIELSQ